MCSRHVVFTIFRLVKSVHVLVELIITTEFWGIRLVPHGTCCHDLVIATWRERGIFTCFVTCLTTVLCSLRSVSSWADSKCVTSVGAWGTPDWKPWNLRKGYMGLKVIMTDWHIQTVQELYSPLFFVYIVPVFSEVVLNVYVLFNSLSRTSITILLAFKVNLFQWWFRAC